MRKFILSTVLLIILAFVFYQVIMSVGAIVMMILMSLSFIPFGIAVFIKWLVYLIGAYILLKIVVWTVKDNK